ncbi:TPA: hypothetical protein R4Z46_004510 [Escherichia coli]|nr:hypothetical protein [Escherichia coli]HED2730976.1 hypothetical protein [Escherichia coli]
MARNETISLAMSWGEWANVLRRLMMSGETKALKEMDTEVARAFAAAEALQQIQHRLPDDLRELACKVVQSEMAKQGYGS